MDDLNSIKNREREEFKLMSKIATSWKNIAVTLHLDAVPVDPITETQYYGDDEKIRMLFMKWLENATDLPCSWYGLKKILIDSGLQEIEKEFSTFLDTCE